MNWIKDGTHLRGEIVELIPLEEKHFEELEALGREMKIWEFYSIDMLSAEKRLHEFSEALKEKEKGTQYPFVIFHKFENRIIGSTRLIEIVPDHKKLEIGWTWLHPDHWATVVNPECKLMLLTFCFEELMAIRVQLKTDENNIRSRTAIQKIGGRYEGFFRQDFIRFNGTIRNTVYFSIIQNEWENVKKNLTTLYKKTKDKNERHHIPHSHD